jgi:hypothetical protein
MCKKEFFQFKKVYHSFNNARGISERLASYLGPFDHCTGYVKPNADLNTITF